MSIITVFDVAPVLDAGVREGPVFDILVTVTILQDGEDRANASDSDAASGADLVETASALAAALGRAVALEALDIEERAHDGSASSGDQ